jgi:hypothetical protein
MFIMEAALVGSTLLLAQVTYQDANKAKPVHEWPHRKFLVWTIHIGRTTVFVIVECCRQAPPLVARRAKHHGRQLLWQLLGRRRHGE